MYGQGSYGPQFRQGPPVHPPPFQQAPPPFQQGHPPPPPPPPPPVHHEGLSGAPPRLVQATHHHPLYHHGPPPPPPPLQQGGPPRPSQHYLHPSPSGYVNHNAQFTSSMPPSGPTLTGPSNQETIRAPLPPRVFPPPLSQGQMSYMNPRHPPPSSSGQGIQHGQLPPPPPSSFIPVTPAPFVSLPQVPVPSDLAHPPPMPSPPPPPPPPPSSPPPPPPSPPPSVSSPDISTRTSTISPSVPLDASSSMSHVDVGSGNDTISGILESVIGNVDKGVSPSSSPDGLPAMGDHLIIDGKTNFGMPTVEDRLSSKTQSVLPPPPKPAAKETVRQIEVLCQYIVKNGSDFEVAARTREHGNPKFAFLFGGEPGSEAAIAHEYFQWMKRKCFAEINLHNGSEQSGFPSRSSNVESSTHPDTYTNDDACHSPADSDMDMEDDAHQFNKDQGVGASFKIPDEFVSVHKEVLNVKEQRLQDQCSMDDPTARNASSTINSSYDISVLAREEKEHDPSQSSAGASECNLDMDAQKCTTPVEDLTPPKASPAAAWINHKEVPNPVSKMGSPFRLIQDYASDDSSEADDRQSFEDISPARVSIQNTVGNTCLVEEDRTDMELNTGSISTVSEKKLSPLTESSFLDPTNMLSRMPDISKELPEVVETTIVASGPSDTNAEANELHNDDHNLRTFCDKGHGDSLQADGDVESQSSKFQKVGEKQDSAALKVDEFGRVVREGVSDSDSDVEHYNGRRYRRGRSRSPLDRRRRSRSPRRRNEKRNRSPSWSPMKRRSMSKSRSPPAFRHTGDFSGEKMRRDGGHTPDCLNFLRGRCYRGASCRFVHPASGPGDTGRRYRGRQQQHVEVPQELSKSVVRGDSHSSVERHEDDTPAKNEHDIIEEDATRTNRPCSDMAASSIAVLKDRDLDEKTDGKSATDDAQPGISIEIGQSATTVNGDVGESDTQEATERGVETPHVQQVLEKPNVQDNEISKLPAEIKQPLEASQPTTEADTQDISGRTSSEIPLTDSAIRHPSEANVPNGEALETKIPALVPEQPLPIQNINTVLTSPQKGFTPQLIASKEFHPTHFSGENYQFQHSQLPPPPPPPVTPQVSQPLNDYNLPPVVTNVYSQPASMERYPPYQAPLSDQYSQSAALSKPSWASLPPPPQYLHGPTSTAASHTQAFHQMPFQQNSVPLMRPYQHGLPSNSQAIEYRSPNFPPTGELHAPPHRTEGTTHNQAFEYPKVQDERFPHSSVFDGYRYHPGTMHPLHQVREEHQFPSQVHDGARNFQTLPNQRVSGYMAQDNMHTQSLPFPNNSPAKQMQSFQDRNSHHNPFSKEDYGITTANHSLAQQHLHPQQAFGMQWSGAPSFPSHMGSAENVGPSTRRYPLRFEDENKPSHLSVSGGSRISARYNPFASTFESMPDSSKFNSNFKQESLSTTISRYDSLGLNQGPKPDSNNFGGQSLPVSGDPYNPFFDSIEPSKESKKFEHVEGVNLMGDVLSNPIAARSTIGSLTVTKSNYSHGTVNTEEKKQVEGVTAAVTTSPENEEFGETAIDTEVGGIESESPDNPVEIGGNTADAENDQVQSKGKSKKSKDSRSMKLFKVALADFVKDVLKPSWRQGNMSKEAFKTIVKKTVDKVAGAMKNHQIPKGQVKINQYVESSQRKLTKLVMGYVDKYVKA